jgi:hypothetical protein
VVDEGSLAAPACSEVSLEEVGLTTTLVEVLEEADE